MTSTARRRHLFIDGQAVEETVKVTQTMHQPTKRGVVVRPDRPSDGVWIEIRDAPFWVPDEQIYKMYYLYGTDHDGNSGTAYAESEDGLTWRKTIVGRALDHGSTENNHVSVEPDLRWPDNYLNGVVYDPDDTEPSRRYKAFIGAHSRQPNVSANGFDWNRLPVAPLESMDESQMTLDRDRRTFIAAVKRRGPHGRSFNLVTSPDFEHWTDHGLTFHADDEDQALARELIAAQLEDTSLARPMFVDPAVFAADIYNMAIFPYEDLYLGLPAFFYHTGPVGRNHDGFHQIQLTVSRDLRTWQRVGNRAPFIPRSPAAPGVFDVMQLLPSARPVEHGDELWFYYTGIKCRCHPYWIRADGSFRPPEERTAAERATMAATGSGGVCLAILRRDGFVSLDAGAAEGTARTRAFTADGNRLFVNVDARRGHLRVDALTPEGTILATSEPVTGDQLRAELRWPGGTSPILIGHPVALRFVLRDASLYSYWFDGGEPG